MSTSIPSHMLLRSFARRPAFRCSALALAVLLTACVSGPDETAVTTDSAANMPARESLEAIKAKTTAKRERKVQLADEYAPAPAAMQAMPMTLEYEEAAYPAAYAGSDVDAHQGPVQASNTERYQHLDDNAIKHVASEPVSTFSLDVDTGSYSNVRRFLAGGSLPPQDAVRVEELVNYFPYDGVVASRVNGEHPFAVGTELAPCPWNPDHWLMKVSVKAQEIGAKALPPANLVFLVDVSGSMDDPAKLPLLKSSLKLLVDQLRAEDRVSLVVYAGREAVVLEPTAGSEREKIRRAIDNLSAGGSTAGEAGIRLAYRMAKSGFIKDGINRVLIATDGDFNVGLTDFQALKDMVEQERATGVQFSSLGFGTGNYNEQLMEQLADAGNGSYAYIDTLQEGRKVLVDQVHSTLVTVAKDVKVQVEFNPKVVSEYRLIGYENRVLAREDFNNDQVDAGDVGAGATVTALYEITPVGSASAIDPLRYGANPAGSEAQREPRGSTQTGNDEIAFVKVRYKQPAGSSSRLLSLPVPRNTLVASLSQASTDLRFATAVAGFGQLLRGGKYTRAWTLDDVIVLANGARGADEFGYRAEFVGLVRAAKAASGS